MHARSLAFLALLAPLAALVGCEKTPPATETQGASSAQASSAPSAVSPPPAAPPQKPAGFDAMGTLADGKAVEYRSAVAFKYKNSPAIRLQLSTHKLTCADVTREDAPRLAEGQDQVEIAVAPVLQGDGKTSWAVMQTFHSTSKRTESGAVGRYADVRLVGEDPAKEVRATLSGWKADAPVGVKIAGTVVAEGCGVVPGPDDTPDESLKARPQKGLTLEVAGKKLEVLGAIYRPDSKKVILSTRSLACGVGPWESEADLVLYDDGAEASMSGLWVDDTDRHELSPPAKVQLGKQAGDTVEAKLDGNFKLGAYPVKLKGSAQLLWCE